MPGVRPVGELGPVGVFLPFASAMNDPDQDGRTYGATYGSKLGTTGSLLAVAEGAERLGAGALWAADHLFWGRPIVEPLTAIAVAATVTRRVALGTCVLQLPLRQPAAVAKQATAIQLLSQGRFVLGVGAGSHEAEFDMVGVDFRARGRLLDQGVTELRRAWATAGDPCLPYRQEPTARPVPVWIGGSSAAARRRAAAVGDGWVPMFLSPGDFAEQRERLAEETAAAGRDPASVAPAVVVMVAVGADPEVHRRGTTWLSSLYSIPPKAFDRHLVAGPPERCAEEVVRYLDAGAAHVALLIAHDHPLDHFAELACALSLGPGEVGAAPQAGDRRPGHWRSDVGDADVGDDDGCDEDVRDADLITART